MTVMPAAPFGLPPRTGTCALDGQPRRDHAGKTAIAVRGCRAQVAELFRDRRRTSYGL